LLGSLTVPHVHGHLFDENVKNRDGLAASNWGGLGADDLKRLALGGTGMT